jgi:hypothetical protein
VICEISHPQAGGFLKSHIFFKGSGKIKSQEEKKKKKKKKKKSPLRAKKSHKHHLQVLQWSSARFSVGHSGKS